MIERIAKLKCCGIFSDYKGDKALPTFKRYNLIYGWNGCGKTTLSRLLAGLENGYLPDYPNLEYQIATNTGQLKQKQPYAVKVRVFNQEYIAENSPSLEDPSTETKHIFILGKEDKTLAAQIEKDKAERATLNDLLSKDDKKNGVVSLTSQKNQLEKARSSLFTDIAKTIASSRGRAFRDYDKRDAQKVFDALPKKEELDDAELQKYQSVIEQNVQAKLNTLDFPADAVRELDEILKKSNDLLAQTVQQKAIERLKENTDIAEWVATGVELHKEHGSERCEYCGQTIPAQRAEELAAHFNEAHKALMEAIETELGKLRHLYAKVNSITVVDKANLYEHLREVYGKDKIAFEKQKQDALDKLTELGKHLADKKVKAHKALSAFERFSMDALAATTQSLNQHISDHNKMTDDFKATIDSAKDRLEKHYVSTIYDDAKRHEKELAELAEETKDANEKIVLLDNAITKNEAKIRNSRIACDKLNKMLEQFLGRDEVCFEDSENGYLIKRGGELAYNLSEGEKTAIAFVYFIISLESDGFDLKKGIVVVDDPISSLDMDSVYRVCALIKAKMKAAHQLILLTHNYEFFNQIKSWFNNDPEVGARDKDPAKVNGQFFMIKNPYDTNTNQRVACLDSLDPLLRDYESEYHYLFKKLANYKQDIIKNGEGTIEAVYPYPNIARKVIECFLSFRAPEANTLYVRLKKAQKLNSDEITDEELEDVNSFINSHSHLNTKTGLMQFDPTLAKNGEKYIQMTLDFIKKCDEKHYDDMVKLA